MLLEYRHLPRSRLASRVIRVVGIGALLVPIAIGALWPAHLLWDEALGISTIVLGTWIPELVTPTTVCWWLGIVCVGLAPLVGSWGRPGPSTTLLRVVSPLAIGCTLVGALGATIGVAITAGDYYVVGEPSPTGCLVIAQREFHGLHHSSTRVGVVQPGEIEVEWLGIDLFDQSLRGSAIEWHGTTATFVDADGTVSERLEGVTVACDA